jgi:hypothetical protein
MKSNELKEYLFSKGYKIFHIKASNILEAKTKAEKSMVKDASLLTSVKLYL